MAKKSSSSSKSTEHSKILLVVIVAVVAFSFGFMIARAKYKTQLNTTYEMVMERESTIKELDAKIQNVESILESR